MINQLDNEMLKKIFKSLNPGILMLSRFVCQRWHILIAPINITLSNDFVDDFELLQWAYNQGCPWDEDTCSYVAENGNFKGIQWLYSKGCPWGDTCWFASMFGHFNIVQWAFGRGAKLNDSVCYYASLHGNLEILKWALINQCPWEPSMCLTVAMKKNHHHIVDWIITTEKYIKYINDI